MGEIAASGLCDSVESFTTDDKLFMDCLKVQCIYPKIDCNSKYKQTWWLCELYNVQVSLYEEEICRACLSWVVYIFYLRSKNICSDFLL